jgi:hypothetical protein
VIGRFDFTISSIREFRKSLAKVASAYCLQDQTTGADGYSLMRVLDVPLIATAFGFPRVVSIDYAIFTGDQVLACHRRR